MSSVWSRSRRADLIDDDDARVARRVRVAVDQSHTRTGPQQRTVDRKGSGANLGARQVGEHTDGSIDAAGDGSHPCQAVERVVDGVMREVEPGDVDARLEHAAEHRGRIRGRTDRGDDLGPADASLRARLHASSSCLGDRGGDPLVELEVGCPVGASHEHVHAALVERRLDRTSEVVVELSAVAPMALATATRSRPCGVPKSDSNVVGSTDSAWGRNEKMPPPSLSTTTTTRSMPRSVEPISPLLSCSKARSPSSTAVGEPLPIATPTAVDKTPSIPLAPLLACTVTPRRGTAYHSRSRTGIDDDTTRCASSGSAASRSRAMPGSVSPVSARALSR